ncbi:hypothetical protein P152DRAFT_458214 [Eremomyces bilateralis CBS 781.70]|uniref:Uncharacterized protein n=1 Tax=Eremomyces bilateralis CBS 781.70 TaxID=1392243 RepID=A0A6G1G540_9PEZI|nr:uncharacterized protein P152DRAFT_458214 [Eremomyces bilateralis CBS 781.70]KAF1813046.1 hypothetical protein P152DRAFT_458214 [Eremomyces bilateralis CBS 781.70]
MAFGQSTVPLGPVRAINNHDAPLPVHAINHHDAPLPDYNSLTSQEQAELRASDRDVFSDDYEAPPPPPTYADSTGNRPSYSPPTNIKEKDPSWLAPPPDDSLYGAQPAPAPTATSSRSPAPSIRSVVTTDPGTFVPGHVLKVSSLGISLVRLPVRYSELEIPIQREDGSSAYMSLRETKATGNSVLMRNDSVGANGQINARLVATTEYNFGPSKHPVIRCMPMGSSGFSRPSAPTSPGQASTDWQNVWEQGKEGVEVLGTGKWTRKTYGFTSPEGGAFEWRYVQERDASGQQQLTIALVMLQNRSQYEGGNARKGKGPEGVTVAQLVRNEDTRPPGVSKNNAGNGGNLVFHRDAPKYISEELVVATCLVMLKKEVDRRRMVQYMMLGAAVVIL